ncbi:dsDNA nuclease domain-containing protein, partial [Halobacteriovorax sp. ZH3_bin.1]
MPKNEELSLLEILAESIPRERGGAVGGSRYDYQKSWGVSKIIELAASSKSFLIIFDYHEDTIILDSIEKPTFINFYQIKSKTSGNWTLAALSRKTEKTSSILAKLLKLKEKYKVGTSKFYFSSNALLNAKMKVKEDKSTQFSSIIFEDLDDKELKKLSEKILKELPGVNIKMISGDVIYQKSKLPIYSTDQACIGYLDEFLSAKFPNHHFRSSDFYKHLFVEVKNKTNCEYLSYDKQWICENKGISDKDFANYLNSANQLKPPSNIWSTIDNHLEKMGVVASERFLLKNTWQEFYLDLVSNNGLCTVAINS